MKKILLSICLVLCAVKSFCMVSFVTPGQADGAPGMSRYVILVVVTVVLVFVLLYLRKLNRKKAGLK